ncbi:Serpin domain [Dillenia turbinata]|uniref:Serpin domain n=1 Tax=Dillenia turbinata TaxID=194707 RepID=A0AAN8U8E1_9MAGN
MEISSSKRSCNQFTMDIAKNILEREAKNGSDSNWVFSPLSLQSNLALLAVGASGFTLNQTLWFLGLKNVEELHSLSSEIMSVASSTEQNQTIEEGPLLHFANGVWIDKRYSVSPSFAEIAKGIYKAEVNSADFLTKAEEAATEINTWVENATKGLIKSIVQRGNLTKSTLLVKANALYFKAAWETIFNTFLTRDKKIFLPNGETLQGESKQFSMYFFLPDKNNGLSDLVDKICSNPFYLTESFNLKVTELDKFWMPKFQISYGFEASNILKKLGLDLPFSMMAELKNITKNVDFPHEVIPLKVSHIVHKAYIEVSEGGTEAAAATEEDDSMEFSMYSPPRPPPPSFVADHPFLFMIREDSSRTLLFIGVVQNPLLVID